MKKCKGRTKYLELHRADFIQGLSQVLADHGPSDLVVALRCGLHCMAGHVVEGDHVGQDAHSFVKGAEPAGEKITFKVKEKITFIHLVSSFEESEYFYLG